MIDKRGSAFGSVFLGIVAIIILFFVFFGTTLINSNAGISNAPAQINGIYNAIYSIVNPIISGIYWIVAPAGQSANVQMIAFAIFLLISLVGTNTLKPIFKNKPLTIVISIIVGIIAARSLTKTVLQQTALAAGPLAAVSLALAFIPILAIAQGIDKWGLRDYSKMTVFIIVGIVYIFIFGYVFDSWSLGATYGIGTIVLGAGQIIAPYFNKNQQQRANMSLGRYIAGVHKTINTASGMQRGDQEANRGN